MTGRRCTDMKNSAGRYISQVCNWLMAFDSEVAWEFCRAELLSSVSNTRAFLDLDKISHSISSNSESNCSKFKVFGLLSGEKFLSANESCESSESKSSLHRHIFQFFFRYFFSHIYQMQWTKSKLVKWNNIGTWLYNK